MRRNSPFAAGVSRSKALAAFALHVLDFLGGLPEEQVGADGGAQDGGDQIGGHRVRS